MEFSLESCSRGAVSTGAESSSESAHTNMRTTLYTPHTVTLVFKYGRIDFNKEIKIYMHNFDSSK